MSTLALLVEGSACSWGKLAVLHGSETINDVIRALISFANSHLSISASNQLLLFAFANKIKRRVHLKRADSSTTSNNEAIASSSSSGRVVIVAMTVDFGTEHSPLMNLFFSAAKHGICVDVVSLVESSPLLQQAADITGGIFLQVEQPSKLLSSMMTHLLGDPSSRSLFPHPTLTEVDYRASCACHHELVSSGWVCSVCLSVLCQFMPICKACGAIFKVNTLLPRKVQKRKRRD
ncbi:transcription factor tfb4 [Ancylostoma caninum]|uniref:General transcription factor IIH subunit 3 n=1 Tax=Ancylostoma caninum TaxID=29170 RepID=A0A368GPE9_ANCCA|nr:transcription factor tfb4 [Ancylostoma caninum]